MILGVRVTPRCEETRFETMESILLPLAEIATLEEPFLAFRAGTLLVTIASEGEIAV